MSNYLNFAKDYPKRCLEFYEQMLPQANRDGREVTLLLMTAATAFVVPFERLCSIGNQPIRDGETYPNAHNALVSLLNKPSFLKSELWNHDVSTWKYGELTKEEVEKLPDDWEELKNPEPMQESLSVKRVVCTIRHAFAHGNLYTQYKQHNLNKQITDITDIVFVAGYCNGTDEYAPRFVQVSTHDFYKFLQKWMDFIKNQKDIPSGVVLENLENAA